jgi:hypothetical protein
MDRMASIDKTLDPIFGNLMSILKGQLWRHIRTNLTPVFTLHKTKMMFYLVDTCGTELADCLHRAASDGKKFQDKCSYKMH